MKTNFVVLFSLILLFITGCSNLDGVFGQKSKIIQDQSTRINQVETKLSQNEKEKLTSIASFSYGIDYSLNKITNQVIPPEVQIAKDMNNRILTLAGAPSIEEIKSMEIMIDNLNSELESSKKRGNELLIERDKIITKIQTEHNKLVLEKEVEIQKYMKLAQGSALQADTLKSQLTELEGNWGINAIWYGVKTLIKRIVWGLFGFGVLYLILRTFAASNPIIGSIFGIFEVAASWAVSFIKGLAPGATSHANLVTKDEHEIYVETFTTMVDKLQELKNKDATKTYTVDEICSSFEFDQAEKDLVNKIKQDLRWK